MKRRILFELSHCWKYSMYLILMSVGVIACQLDFTGYLTTCLLGFSVAVIGEELINYLLNRGGSEADSLMKKKLTDITPEGDYSLSTEYLYEAVEKLGYIEHELMKGENKWM